MALLLFVIIPIGWALTGWLLGLAVSLTVSSDGGKRCGRRLGRWCMWLLPAVHSVLVLAGLTGNAGQGFRVFGSDEFLAVLCGPVYLVPALGLYVLAVYVIRDLIRGLYSRESW